MMPPFSNRAISAWPSVLLLIVSGCVFGVPIVTAAGAVARGLLEGAAIADPPAVSAAALLRSIGWAFAIGGLAALLAAPLAWWSRGLSRRGSWVLIAPVLLPMPLAYAGLNALRAPGTGFGEWLALGPSWRAVLVGRLIAVLALALWAAPLAAMIQSARLRALPVSLSESLRADGAGPTVRSRVMARLVAGAWFLSAAMIALLMLGSAVPLHLARIPTASIGLWLELDALPRGEAWRVWLAAWPLALIAAAAAVLVARAAPLWLAARADPQRSIGGGRLSAVLSAAVVVLAAGLPLALLAGSMQSLTTFSTLWRTERGAILDSAVVAIIVGAIGSAGTLTARLAADRTPRLTAMILAFGLFTALAPGILVGSAVGESWTGAPQVAESAGILVLAHLARFGVIAVLAGIALSLAEPTDARDRRRVDGATGPIAALLAAGPGAFGSAALVGVVLAVLSLSEIEATVIVSPPGRESVARSLLGMLHFARDEHMAGLMLIQAGAVAALIGAAALVRAVAARRSND
ncbi:MAG: hypothetical protein AAGF47_02780 [Planctomycetota bacterium]